MKIMTIADVANSCHSHELQHNNPSFPTTMNEASNYHETLKKGRETRITSSTLL
jgi:hypothetical protein